MGLELVPAGFLYRREARRLRARLHDRPHQLYGSLRQLAERQDAPHGAAASAPATPVTYFTDMVAGQLRDTILPYPTRLTLLRNAARLGIGRFEANLIIAAMQHRMKPQNPET